MALRILLSAALGGVIGFQREKEGKEAGLRTHILICVGSALFTVVSMYAFGGDPARIAAGVVAGIGFLGAGTILKTGGGVVRGLTTAASIWITAAIGLAAGAGLYIIAAVTTVIALVVCWFFIRALTHKKGIEMTLAEKILAAHSGRKKVSPGEFISARVDMVLSNDITAPIAIREFRRLGVKRSLTQKGGHGARPLCTQQGYCLGGAGQNSQGVRQRAGHPLL
jgi:putative Mg2+ transporter-C (MgtC) family protein